MSDKIKPHHLQRKGLLYIRQSSPDQVLHNQESRRLQYAMKERLEQLGWQEIEVIDDDLGYSASGTVTRQGFERMVAEVCLGKVGVVAARELSRFARNNREWQQLIEMCRVVDTLLLDKEMVYAPRESNDRLLLGLKGSLNEYELDLLRARSVEARHAKARRGELVVSAPVGFLKTPDQRLEKDPDRRVQEAILLVYRKFRELGSVRQTLLWFLDEGLQLPARRPDGAIMWKRPIYATLWRLLTNPIYGGAYAYGKTEAVTSYVNGQARRGHRQRCPQQWLALIPEAHEGYISWEEFQKIQQMLDENVQGWGRRGAVKHGAALLSGLLRCRRCGRKIAVHYSGNKKHGFLRYGCVRGWLDLGEPKCIAFGGIPVDEAIGREILRVVQPGAVEAAVLASQQIAHQQDDVQKALRRDLEAARYEAQRAQKQFDAVDPENRLVADELERRWNQALKRVYQLEQRLDEQLAGVGEKPSATVEEFQNLTADLEAIWHGRQADARLKKRIVRTLIHEVVADIDAVAGEVILVIHWQGGVHTELRLPRRRRGACGTATSKDIVAAVRSLARICDDTAIAGVLNRNGLRTGRGNRWTRCRLTSMRCKNSIPVYSEADAAQNWLTLTQAARFLGISTRTMRLAVEQRRIEGEHPLPDGPWIFSRQALQTEAAAQVVKQARDRRTPAVPNPEDENGDLFGK
jgi:DNA invertase Pin-like site-specific DNA recombinase